MIRFLIFITLFVSSLVAKSSNDSFTNETLKYRVMYKWGLINKQAGHATLTIQERDNQYITKLVAHSETWADKLYCVRDTLNGIMSKEGLKPIFYEKIAHEGSEDKHDTVKFSYSGNAVTGHTTRKVIKKGQLKHDQQLLLTAEGQTVDMLSSFYVMRSLPFQKWHKGHKQTLSIFSGKLKETLTFEYQGIEPIEVDNKTYNCYHITFIFTGKGGKKTSDNMDAWITADNKRIPVLLEGKLPVGKVKCELIN